MTLKGRKMKRIHSFSLAITATVRATKNHRKRINQIWSTARLLRSCSTSENTAPNANQLKVLSKTKMHRHESVTKCYEKLRGITKYDAIRQPIAMFFVNTRHLFLTYGDFGSIFFLFKDAIEKLDRCISKP